MDAENQVSYFSNGPEGGFTYSKERYIPSDRGSRVSFIRRGSLSPGPINQRSFSEMSTEVSSLLRSSKALDGRLSKLEMNRAAMKPEGIREQPRIDQEAVDERWAADMEILGEGSYEEKGEVYQKHEDAGLNPSEAKEKYQQDKSDDSWVDEMLGHGGQNPN
ncbi:MAG: hypothetical protein ISS59_01015 [Desulfobacteraceae bacterium]|nr:hypothetical protein [Desulfobacteraceae bacterium]